ncbi:MAG: response regulator [Lawsonibacter sp.]|nr:response regulator [Lawsonibacter sp.]
MDSRTLYTVVVADDEDELREAVCTMIPWQDLGFRLVGSASNGLDALQLVEELEPDLLLTDIRMPFISGIELARQVREVLPATHIAFLSGYDDFEYAQQAIQYNIIRYMLKPLTVKGLGEELKIIRQKIDAQFALFRQAAPQSEGQGDKAAMLAALVLDDCADPEGSAQAEGYARQCGLVRDGMDRPCYTVMVSALLNGEGCVDTFPSFAASVDRLAAKYLRSASFFAPGKVITVLLGGPSDFEEYLYILAEEIPQMAHRVLGRRCRVGVSRMTGALSALHDAYREAMEALRHGDRTETGSQFVGDLEPAVKGGSLLCRRALEALEQHYMDPGLSLVSLSEMLDVSPNHLSACIKKYAGETFINTLIRKRMEAAQTMLATSSLKVREIAGRCGYTDQHYFSYCFKKYCGESPNSMRRRLDAERTGEQA